MKVLNILVILAVCAHISPAHATDAPSAEEGIAAPAVTPPAPPPAPEAEAPPVPTQMPAPMPAIQVAKKVELMDGSWALVDGDKVKISTDNGETWSKAPDQTWVAKDGSKLATKNGKILK